MSCRKKMLRFASFDIEADGPSPMTHNMRSLGIAIFNPKGEILDSFYVTIEAQVSAEGTSFLPDPQCLEEFWNHHPEQWTAVQQNAVSPTAAMEQLTTFITPYYANGNRLQWVADPANFDWMWLKGYYEKYGPSQDKPDIGYYCHDLSSLIRAYCLCHKIHDKSAFRRALSQGAPYTHRAIDDATCQGIMYCNLRRLLS